MKRNPERKNKMLNMCKKINNMSIYHCWTNNDKSDRRS